MELSIVTTLFRSEPYVTEFYRRIRKAAKEITDDFDIVMVNDGSPDNSLEVALSIHKRDKKVKIIDLSRNFGHHKAMMTGLAHAKGKWVFAIDCDLEEDPELLGKFFDEISRSKADVVYGVQSSRQGNIFRRVSGHLFYRLFNLLSNYPIPENLTTTRLMSRRYVSALVQHKDREMFIAGLWAITGFKQVPLFVERHYKGDSAYTFRRKISIFVNSLTSFSDRPLLFIFYLGIAIAALASVAALYEAIRILLFGSPVPGWPSLIVSVWLLGGLTILSLGVIGIYLSKIFMETKERPYTIIREIYGSD